MKKIILLMVTLFFSLNVSAAIVVIGNPAAGIDALSQKNVKKLFMGKKTKLPNGDKAKLIELLEGSAERIAFHDLATGRSETQLQSAWSRLVFTGKAEAPTQVANDAEVIQAVIADKNAIGYIDEVSVTENVTVLLKL